MNDTGDGLILVVSMGDTGMFQPVETKLPGQEPKNVEFTFDYFMNIEYE